MLFIITGVIFMCLSIWIIKNKKDSGVQPYFFDYFLIIFLGYNGLISFIRCWGASSNGVTIESVIYATYTVACFAVLRWAWQVMRQMSKEWS